MGVVSKALGAIGSLFGGGEKQAAPAAVAAEKPISPITNRATIEATTRRRRQASLLSAAPAKSTTLLNTPTGPLG